MIKINMFLQSNSKYSRIYIGVILMVQRTIHYLFGDIISNHIMLG